MRKRRDSDLRFGPAAAANCGEDLSVVAGNPDRDDRCRRRRSDYGRNDGHRTLSDGLGSYGRLGLLRSRHRNEDRKRADRRLCRKWSERVRGLALHRRGCSCCTRGRSSSRTAQ